MTDNSQTYNASEGFSSFGVNSNSEPVQTYSPRRQKNLRQFFLAIAATLAVVLAIDLAFKMPAYVDFKGGDVAGGVPHDFKPAPIDASWIVSGTPVFRNIIFERSPHWGTLSGLWECIGPGKFVWHYSVDEVIYVLDGSAEIDYLGKTFTLHAGDSTRFIAGTTATWVVNDHIRKTFRIQKPGILVRMMRGIFGYIDA